MVIMLKSENFNYDMATGLNTPQTPEITKVSSR